ncbi:MAG: TonB-dependent receptor [Porticoccaceae bacterium]|nr:MAG: TonB-dependent receptor [Porticoccaceae bacterium]
MNKKLLAGLAFAATPGLLTTLEAAAAEGQERAGGLEEIIVTARKREESLQDAPLAVVAIPQERIEKFDVTSLEKIAALTPNFFTGHASNGSGAQMTLRGIGSSSTSIGIEQSVAVVVDGVYYGYGRILEEGMFDLAQIEVLKGPQALFFGKNATAGVINIRTAKPTDEVEAIARASYEFEGEEARVEGILSGPLSDTVGARLAVRYTDMDGGYFKNISTPQPYNAFDVATGQILPDVAPADNREGPAVEELLARLTLTFAPSDDLDVTLTASYDDNETVPSSWNYTHFNCPGGVGTLNPNLRCGDKFVITQNRMPSLLANSLPHARKNGELYNDYQSSSVTATVEYRFGDFSLVSISNYQENRNLWALSGDFQSWPNATFATEKNSWEAISEELRITSDFAGPVNFLLGFLYQETEREFDQWVATAGLMNSAAPDPRWVHVANVKDSATDGETLSPFFQVMWDVTDAVELSAGARYTDEKKDSWFVHPYNNPGLGGIWRTGEYVRAKQNFDEWSPEVTVSWRVNPDVLAYAAWKNGYKSGGFSNSGIFSADFMGGSPSDFTFEPETAEGYEVGLKSTLLDNQLRLNLVAYTYEYDDLQVDFFNSPTFAFITLNAGKATTEGVELEGEFAPLALPQLRLRGSLAYNNAEYDDFIAPCWAGQTPEQGCNTTVPGTNGTPGQDISGEHTAMAPEWTASWGLSWDDNLPNGLGWGIAVDGLFTDDYNASGFANPHARRDAYTTWNAALYLAAADDTWRLKLLGKNLTDEHIVSGVVDGPSTPPPGSGLPYAEQIGFTSLPRTVAVELTWRFR